MKFYIACILFLVTGTSFAVPAKTGNNNSFNIGRFTIGYKNKDTANINRLIKLAGNVFKSSPDSAVYFAKKSLVLARDINFKQGIGYSLLQIGHANYFKGNLDTAKANLDEAILVFSNLNDKKGLANSYILYGQILNYQADYK